jgi:hypothetical protein
VAALVLLGVLTLAALWYPVRRISQREDINYNEGWNAYRAQAVVHGDALYSAPPAFTVTNYPPLSFHLLAFFGKFLGGYTAAGRWLSLASLAFLSLLIAMLVRQYAGRWSLGIYAALLFALGMAVFAPNRVAMDDPQFFGLAWSFAGLYIYVKNPRSYRILGASAAAFAISLFIKHNLLAFPAAVGIHLLLERAWKHFSLWLGAAAAISAALLALTFWRDGPYFFLHLLSPRSYSLLSLAGRTLPYLIEFQIPFAVAVFWCVRYAGWPMRRLLVIAFLLANLFGVGFSGGYGVDENILFDAVITIVAITAIGIGDLEPKLMSLQFGNLLLFLALTIPCLAVAAPLPELLRDGLNSSREQAKLDGEFGQAVEFLESRPGPALCEDLLLCYQAGKPPLYDAFYANSQLKTGRVSEAELRDYIQVSRFPTVEITIPSTQPLAPAAMLRFSEPVLRAILERYRPALRTSEFTLLIPKEKIPKEESGQKVAR